jgi:hypothetical protein
MRVDTITLPIYYSHRDSKWLEIVMNFLRPLEKWVSLSAWADIGMAWGTKWYDEIVAVLMKAPIALLASREPRLLRLEVHHAGGAAAVVEAGGGRRGRTASTHRAPVQLRAVGARRIQAGELPGESVLQVERSAAGGDSGRAHRAYPRSYSSVTARSALKCCPVVGRFGETPSLSVDAFVSWAKGLRRVAVMAGAERPGWQKSGRCESNACVEVARREGAVYLRDGKDPAGPQLIFSAGQWTSFLSWVRQCAK